MKATHEARRSPRRSGSPQSAPAKARVRPVERKGQQSKATKDVDSGALPTAKPARLSDDLVRRMARVERQVATVRREVRASLLAGAAAELRAVNAEQARAGLQRLHASLLEMQKKGIADEGAEAAYGQTAEDVV